MNTFNLHSSNPAFPGTVSSDNCEPTYKGPVNPYETASEFIPASIPSISKNDNVTILAENKEVPTAADDTQYIYTPPETISNPLYSTAQGIPVINTNSSPKPYYNSNMNTMNNIMPVNTYPNPSQPIDSYQTMNPSIPIAPSQPIDSYQTMNPSIPIAPLQPIDSYQTMNPSIPIAPSQPIHLNTSSNPQVSDIQSNYPSISSTNVFIQPPPPIQFNDQSINYSIRSSQSEPFESSTEDHSNSYSSNSNPSVYSQISNIGSIEDYPVNDIDLRQSLIDYVSKKVLWNKYTAENMDINKVDDYLAYFCKIENYIDERKAEWRETPCDRVVDPLHNVNPPAPFDVCVETPTLFTENKRVIHVPHTDTICDCYQCKCKGSIVCSSCHSKGYGVCSSCHGKGSTKDSQNHDQQCFLCSGTGQKMCYLCNGTGYETCDHCDGHRMMIAYVELTVQFHTEILYTDININSFPSMLLHECENDIVYSVTGYPISMPKFNLNYFDKPLITLKAKADDVINSKPCRIISQRITIYKVPIHCVSASIQDETFTYYVYGHDNICHCPNYPKKLFGKCSIL